MKTSISKNISHSLLIREDDASALYTFLASHYEKIEIIAYCIDGSRLETDTIDDILKFENPNFRCIKALSIKARNDWENQLSLKLSKDKETTVEYFIDSRDDEKATYITNEVIKRLGEMKASYDIITRISIFKILLILMISFGMIFTAAQIAGILPWSNKNSQLSTIESFNVGIYLALMLFGITYAIDWCLKKLFPKVFFMFGKQKRTMEKLKRIRNMIFRGLILSIATGVIAGLILKLLL